MTTGPTGATGQRTLDLPTTELSIGAIGATRWCYGAVVVVAIHAVLLVSFCPSVLLLPKLSCWPLSAIRYPLSALHPLSTLQAVQSKPYMLSATMLYCPCPTYRGG